MSQSAVSTLERPALSSLSLRTKVLLLAIVPLVMLTAVIAFASYQVERYVFEEQKPLLEASILSSKERELAFLLDLAFSTVKPILDRADWSEEQKQQAVKDLFSKELVFGDDGYFFIYDQKGVNIVHPKKPDLQGKSLWDHQDSAGNYVIRLLLAQARQGKGLVHYRWGRPSTQQEEEKIGYAKMLEEWNWMIGTGFYDVSKEVQKNLDQAENSVKHTFNNILVVLIITILIMILLVFLVNLRESHLASQSLKILIQNFIHLQVEERRHFARELHDGVNQLLVAAKFKIELALRQIQKGSAESNKSLEAALKVLDDSISEIHNISHSLRPSLLDEMGLAVALNQLALDFSERTGINLQTHLEVDVGEISGNTGIMVYRVVQEALMNMERHSQAETGLLKLTQDSQNLYLTITDQGKGFDPEHLPEGKGLGLKHMRERIELLGGTFELISSSGQGTQIKASLTL